MQHTVACVHRPRWWESTSEKDEGHNSVEQDGALDGSDQHADGPDTPNEL